MALLVGLVAVLSLSGTGSVAAGEPQDASIYAVIEKSSPDDARALRACVFCHLFNEQEIAAQGRLARKKHKRVLSGKKVCIDCHESDEMCCHETVFARVELVPYDRGKQVGSAIKGM